MSGLRYTKAAAAVGFGGQRPIAEKHQQRRLARRKIIKGFPWDGQFQTAEEVARYFSGDVIQCLLCGLTFKALCSHLKTIHATNAEDYKRKFGLPWRHGLVGDRTHQIMSQITKDRAETNEPLKAALKAGREQRLGQPMSVREKAPYILKMMGERIKNFSVGRSPPNKHGDGVAEEMLRRIATGRTPREVMKDDGMPQDCWWHDYRKKHPDFERRFLEVMERLPFNVQARAQRLGARFDAELRTLSHLNNREAAKVLGVSEVVVGDRRILWAGNPRKGRLP